MPGGAGAAAERRGHPVETRCGKGAAPATVSPADAAAKTGSAGCEPSSSA